MTKPNNTHQFYGNIEFTLNLKEKYISRFRYYKSLGDKTLGRLSDEEIHWKPASESNNIAIIVKHMVGNMLSRWTDFLNSDGEKEWRQRDEEFVDDIVSREELMGLWEKGWACLFGALEPLTAEDFQKLIKIRDEDHTVPDAINRQLAHYAYHVGQIVSLGVIIKNQDWESLSIPKGKSGEFNDSMFSKTKD